MLTDGSGNSTAKVAGRQLPCKVHTTAACIDKLASHTPPDTHALFLLPRSPCVGLQLAQQRGKELADEHEELVQPQVVDARPLPPHRAHKGGVVEPARLLRQSEGKGERQG